MQATRLRINLPREMRSAPTRAMVAAILNGRVSGEFFRPRNDDAYPTTIVASYPRQDGGHAVIITATGKQEQELIQNLPVIISGFQARFGPCQFNVTTVYPTISTAEAHHKYVIHRPVPSRSYRCEDARITGKEAADLLEQAVRRGVRRFAELAGVDIPDFDFYTDLARQDWIDLKPVVVERRGKEKYSYLCMPNCEFVTNLAMRDVYLGGMATHGHGAVRHV